MRLCVEIQYKNNNNSNNKNHKTECPWAVGYLEGLGRQGENAQINNRKEGKFQG